MAAVPIVDAPNFCVFSTLDPSKVLSPCKASTTARATSSAGAAVSPSPKPPYTTARTLMAYSLPLPPTLPITCTIIGTASAWALTSAAPSSTVQSSSSAASALSAAALSMSASASTTFPAAPASTAACRFPSARHSASSTLVAGFAPALSFK
ncbi:hypothetical protein RJ640_013554 [Escallonia rubra]|uniref:Uncharacterized protein n=1 Tax=Escallonia rubra TaxID=112253 RepID=A0AA88QZY2_9ASTE|nr:hypothetical protein RJ640_013554 [Escallonia rubra]